MNSETNDNPKSILRTGRYALFWVSSLLSNIGTWMQQIAQPWVVLNLSNSAFWVGLDGFALNAPGLLFTLAGGVIADRFERRRTVYFFQAIQFLCVLAMVVLLVLGWLKVWMIVCISFLIGVTDALSWPSFQSIIPSLVNPKEIPHAVSLNSTQFNLSRILGPAIAGVVIARYGAVVCFSANAASYVPFFLSLYFIYPRGGLKLQPATEPPKPGTLIKEFKQLLLQPMVRIPLITALITNLFCGPLITFCSVLVKNIFHGQADNFGGAMTAFGVGGLIGAASSFIPLPARFQRNKFSSLVAIVLGGLAIAVALNKSFVVLIGLLVLTGAALTTVNIGLNTFLQTNATNATRGRIASMFQLVLSGGISLGALLTGFTVSQRSHATSGSEVSLRAPEPCHREPLTRGSRAGFQVTTSRADSYTLHASRASTSSIAPTTSSTSESVE